jgi:hypothetical protein
MIKSLLNLSALVVGLMTFSSTSHAYFVAVPPGQGEFDASRTTRILVSGRGTDLGLQPQEAAMTTAVLYRNQPKLAAAGWQILVQNEVKLNTESATSEISRFNRIQSLEFFGHNSPHLGTQADGLGFRFDFREKIVTDLSDRFLPNAFGWIHGCNSGWIIAPELSRAWNIPVASSLTETRFERLHSDGHFYVYSTAKAPNTAWAKTNPDLENIPCDQGGCIRMRPAYSAYRGHWGNFAGPILSHYKFFCPLETKECEKRMALAMAGFVTEKSLKPTSDLASFRQTAKEFLCPLYKDRKVTNECLKALTAVDAGKGNRQAHFVVNDKQLACGFDGCKAVMTCTDKICTIADRVSDKSTTLVDEYVHLVNGFKLLREESK